MATYHSAPSLTAKESCKKLKSNALPVCRAFLFKIMDTIKHTLSSFINLKKNKYRLVVSAGRGKPIEEILLNFYDDDLYHILGFQHLTDLDLPKSKKVLFSDICNGKITDEFLSQSIYFNNSSLNYNIKIRIEMAGHLENFLDSEDFSVSTYRLQHDNHTSICADYLITCKRFSSDEEYYIFIRKRIEESTFGIVSCFQKEEIAYWGGIRYLMLKEKINGDKTIVQYKHPNYK